jgi:hypothetical protein
MSDEQASVGSSPGPVVKEQIEQLLRTAPNEVLANAYKDVRSNEPKNNQAREHFRHSLEDKFDLSLAEAVERIWELPAVILKRADDEYVRLYVEASDLFVGGYFYSCVAMCGIVGEKLVKDLLRASVVIKADGTSRRPSDEAFDQLEHVDVSAIVRFLNRAQLLSDRAAKATTELAVLRNQYAHARGKSPKADALKSLGKLHILLEGTVSILKDHEIVEGKFVPRTAKT